MIKKVICHICKERNPDKHLISIHQHIECANKKSLCDDCVHNPEIFYPHICIECRNSGKSVNFKQKTCSNCDYFVLATKECNGNCGMLMVSPDRYAINCNWKAIKPKCEKCGGLKYINETGCDRKPCPACSGPEKEEIVNGADWHC